MISSEHIQHLLNNCIHRTVIGLKVKDGVVLAVENLVHSKLLVSGANRRIQTIDPHIGLVCPPFSSCIPYTSYNRPRLGFLLMDGTFLSEREKRLQTTAEYMDRHLRLRYDTLGRIVWRSF